MVRTGDPSEFEAIFGFVKANQAAFPVRVMCRLLKVSASGYYAWLRRPRSQHALMDIALSRRIEAIYRRSHGIYGSPRVHAQLRNEGIHVARKRVARLMREAAFIGVSRRRFVVTTQRDSSVIPAKDLVNRSFEAKAADRLWVADITYISTWTEALYLAIVLDVFSRRVVGWAMETHLRSELVLKALEMAYLQRCPQRVIHHSDQGVQYTSVAFGQRCKELGIRPSTGSVGDCFDNAMAESFFASLECELLDRQRFKDPTEARTAVFEYIEGFYNPHRLHSSLGYLSPINYERSRVA